MVLELGVFRLTSGSKQGRLCGLLRRNAGVNTHHDRHSNDKLKKKKKKKTCTPRRSSFVIIYNVKWETTPKTNTRVSGVEVDEEITKLRRWLPQKHENKWKLVGKHKPHRKGDTNNTESRSAHTNASTSFSSPSNNAISIFFWRSLWCSRGLAVADCVINFVFCFWWYSYVATIMGGRWSFFFPFFSDSLLLCGCGNEMAWYWFFLYLFHCLCGCSSGRVFEMMYFFSIHCPCGCSNGREVGNDFLLFCGIVLLPCGCKCCRERMIVFLSCVVWEGWLQQTWGRGFFFFLCL